MKIANLALATLSAVLLASASSPASATRMTLTFDSGGYDTTIHDPNYHGPYAWLENGARIAGYWAEDVGTAAGNVADHGHTHLRLDSGNPTGWAERTHSLTNDIIGLELSLDSGLTFDLISLDYDVYALSSTDPNTQRLPWSFAVNDPHFLFAEDFDPTAADYEGQWTAIQALTDGNPRTHDWRTLSLTGLGLTNLSRILISQTAGQTWIDNIVIEVHDVAPIPEPSTALLLGLGLVALAGGRSKPVA